MKETLAMFCFFFHLPVSVAGNKSEDRKWATHTTGDPPVFLLQLFSAFFRDVSDDPSASALFPSNCCLILALLVIIMLMKHGWVVYKRTYWSRPVKHSSFPSVSDVWKKENHTVSLANGPLVPVWSWFNAENLRVVFASGGPPLRCFSLQLSCFFRNN